MSRHGFASKFAHLDTDSQLECNGVSAPVPGSDIVLLVRRAGGRNYGFEKHREEVSKSWKKTHGTAALGGEDLRRFNRDVFSHCIAGWDESVVGAPWDADAARELIDIESVYQTVVTVSGTMENYLKGRVADAKEKAGNG